MVYTRVKHSFYWAHEAQLTRDHLDPLMMDHKHPDFGDLNIGVISPEAQASVDATADFLTLMHGALGMTKTQFKQGLEAYKNKWLQQKLPPNQ